MKRKFRKGNKVKHVDLDFEMIVDGYSPNKKGYVGCIYWSEEENRHILGVFSECSLCFYESE